MSSSVVTSARPSSCVALSFGSHTATADATGRGQRYDTSARQPSKKRAMEIGKSISPSRMGLTTTTKDSEAKVLDEKSLDFADEETKKAYQDALKLERAAAKRVTEIADTARTMQIERKRAAETGTCVPMEEDTKTPTSMEQDDEVEQLLAKMSKEAEQRAYLAKPGEKRKNQGKPCS